MVRNELVRAKLAMVNNETLSQKHKIKLMRNEAQLIGHKAESIRQKARWLGGSRSEKFVPQTSVRFGKIRTPVSRAQRLGKSLKLIAIRQINGYVRVGRKTIPPPLPPKQKTNKKRKRLEFVELCSILQK